MSLKRAESIRNRLLGCLAPDSLVTDEAKRVLSEILAANAIPPNRPPTGSFAVYRRKLDDDEYLSEQGVPLGETSNREIASLIKPVRTFESTHLNTTPTAEAVAQALPHIRVLRDALASAEANHVHPKLAEHAWAAIAEAAGRIARIDALRCTEPVGSLTKEILLEACRHPDPTHDPDRDAQFDDSPSWGGGQVRIEAAEGILGLARHPSCVDDSVLQAVERLAQDPVPAVRYQICRYLNALYETDQARMWRLVENCANNEQSRGVLQGLLDGTFDRLYRAERERIAELTVAIYDRVRDGAGSQRVREQCVQILTNAYARFGHAGAWRVLNAIASEPEAQKRLAVVAVSCYREALVLGPTEPPDPESDAIRRRAIGFISGLLDTVQRKHDRLLQTHPQRFKEWPEAARNALSDLMEIAAGIGTELYFGSGAYGASNGSTVGSLAVRARFYTEAREIIGKLADVGEPSLAHHLLEIVEYLIPVDASGAFLLVARIVQGGKKGGYQYDSLAVDLLVRLVARYLADYRPVLREHEEVRRALSETLDVFVDAGWPAARALVYRLDEMYRV